MAVVYLPIPYQAFFGHSAWTLPPGPRVSTTENFGPFQASTGELIPHGESKARLVNFDLSDSTADLSGSMYTSSQSVAISSSSAVLVSIDTDVLPVDQNIVVQSPAGKSLFAGSTVDNNLVVNVFGAADVLASGDLEIDYSWPSAFDFGSTFLWHQDLSVSLDGPTTRTLPLVSPDGIEGALILLTVVGTCTSTVSLTPPTGFTEIASIQNGSTFIYAYYHRMTSSLSNPIPSLSVPSGATNVGYQVSVWAACGEPEDAHTYFTLTPEETLVGDLSTSSGLTFTIGTSSGSTTSTGWAIHGWDTNDLGVGSYHSSDNPQGSFNSYTTGTQATTTVKTPYPFDDVAGIPSWGVKDTGSGLPVATSMCGMSFVLPYDVISSSLSTQPQRLYVGQVNPTHGPSAGGTDVTLSTNVLDAGISGSVPDGSGNLITNTAPPPNLQSQIYFGDTLGVDLGYDTFHVVHATTPAHASGVVDIVVKFRDMLGSLISSTHAVNTIYFPDGALDTFTFEGPLSGWTMGLPMR